MPKRANAAPLHARKTAITIPRSIVGPSDVRMPRIVLRASSGHVVARSRAALLRQQDEELPVLDLHRERLRAPHVGRLGLAVVQPDDPAVQRTGDGAAEDDAL